MNILIPNATSPNNNGDQAMLTALINRLRFAFPTANITIHSMDNHIQSKRWRYKTRPDIISWIAYSSKKPHIRVFRFVFVFSQLFSITVFHRTCMCWLCPDLLTILSDYKKSDLIVFVGNGSYRSRSGLSQAVYLILHLSEYMFSYAYKKPVVISPISFGPFAYTWQQHLCAKVLGHALIISTRENISRRLLTSCGIKNVLESIDLAFDTPLVQKQKRNLYKPIVGFTLRNWFHGSLQMNFERNITQAFIAFSQKYPVAFQPIVQAHGHEHGDFDYDVCVRIAKECESNGVKVLRPIVIKTLPEACRVYRSIDILVGMRMHSNILSATQGTPFIAIEYEHKTKGIAQSIGMEKWSIHCEQVTSQKLFSLLNDIFTKRKQLSKKLLINIKKLRNYEFIKWMRIFESVYPAK